MKIKFIVSLIISLFLFASTAIATEIDWEQLKQQLRIASAQAAERANIATQDEWNKIEKQQRKEIDEIMQAVKLLDSIKSVK